MTRELFGVFLILAVAGTTSFAQQQDDLTSPSANGTPGYVRMPVGDLSMPVGPLSSTPLLVFPSDAATSAGSFSSDENAAGGPGGSAPSTAAAGRGTSPIGGVIPGLDTLPTFAGAFAGQAGPSQGSVFPFIMVGNDPGAGDTTSIPTRMTAVSLLLLNADGSLNATVPFAPFEDLVTDSPNFHEADYASGRAIQFGDAIQRAEFFNHMKPDWHTVLDEPTFVNRVTFTIPRFVNVRFPDGSIKAVQAYYLGHAPNGDPFVELLDLLFNALNFNQAVTDIIAGNFTTDAINFNVYPNTFLFSINNMGQFAGCCVLGFHNYIYMPGKTPQPRWIFDFASIISPGLFRGFVDVTGLSHEISETLNDPFVNTRTPLWQFPGVPPTAKICQGNLETGDPVEVLSTTTVPITIRERKEVVTYHPQTEALLQWFEMGATSDAIGGAFSFPDTSALPHSALPCPQ
jgi:hypothetical protein